jgi:precorrin-6B methylase 1
MSNYQLIVGQQSILTVSIPSSVTVNTSALQWSTDNSDIMNLTSVAGRSDQILVQAQGVGTCVVTVTDGVFSGTLVVNNVGVNANVLTIIPGVSF